MISHLSGTAIAVRQGFLVLDVHDVGYKIHCTARLLEQARTTRELSLHIHTVVREDALELFGFPTYEELELFQLLIGISGIGPRSALGIVGLESVEKLVSAIAHGDVGYLTKVSGVGKKSAEKIVLELRDKVSMLNITDVRGIQSEDEDVLEALKTLGYRADEAREALHAVPEGVTEQGARIKEALRLLSRK
ncbi:MAG: Holliday junction branch migration protein RuvA [Candidatus Pacebacteria bacterium]|nr:Holliday junction branch migration protein RuvA [Candidatus Paceibacterota bacterium]